MKKRLLIVSIASLLIIGVFFVYKNYTGDKSSNHKTPDTVAENSQNPDSDKPAEATSEKPKKVENSFAKSCKDIASAIKTEFGKENYDSRVAENHKAMPINSNVCEYSSGSKTVKVIMHDFGHSRNAGIVKNDLSSEYQVKVESAVLYAVSVQVDGNISEGQSKKLLESIIKI